MKKNLMLLIVISTLQFTAISAQKTFTVESVVLPRTIQFKNTTLSLNGAGGKSKIWLGSCVQSLYLSQLTQDPEYIIDGDIEMAIRIDITSTISPSTKFTKLIYDHFKKSAGNNLELLRSKLEELDNLLSGEIRQKDVFKFIFSPIDPTVFVYKNGALRGEIKGTHFKKAFFGIWLSDEAADQKLKNQLLGK